MDSGSAPHSRPQRGLIRGLWSLVALLGQSARSSGEGCGSEGGIFNVDVVSRGLRGWVMWWRYRSAKRRVAEHINLFRAETVARSHLIKWFQYCELGLPPSARGSRNDLDAFARTSAENAAQNADISIQRTEDVDFLMSPGSRGSWEACRRSPLVEFSGNAA